MLEFIGSIGQSIGVFLNYITSTISGILQVFALVGQSVAFLMVFIDLLPPLVKVFALTGLSVVVFYHLLGR